MKYLLILLLSVLLFSCKKTEPLQIVETKNYYYKIVEFDVNGKTSESPIRHIGVDQVVSSKDEDEDEDEDEDDDHTTCPIKLETISITQSGDNVIIYWEAENEDNVNYYEVQKSTDAINYELISTKQVSPDGKYKVVDKIK
jgi:hypothetical protein